MRRRTFLSTSAALTLPAFLKARAQTTPQPDRMKLIIDADTANEIDDLYAIVRALLEPRFHILGLSSAQWNHRLSPPDTVLASQALNDEMLRLMGRRDIPTPMGAEMIMGKPWGGDEPSNSPAAQLIIETARNLPEGEKLTVASLGAVTNLASAIKLAPDITPKLRCYGLLGQYDSQTGVWNKDEFNLRNDLNAANFLLNTPDLDLHIMPTNILRSFQFQRDDTLKRLAGKGGVWDLLASRWLSHSPASPTWIMWDLALITALARPELATEAPFATPPENHQRKVWVYTAIDSQKMLENWWATVDQAPATP